jgi:hypothetical protein
VGRSASGKDTLAAALADEGLKPVKSRTTRPKRGDDDNSHVFLTDADWESQKDNAIASTEIASNQYWVLEDDLEGCDTYIVDPKGLDDMCMHVPERSVDLIYVRAADDDSRIQMALSRAGATEEAKKLVDERQASEKAAFDEFESRVEAWRDGNQITLPEQVASVLILENDYQPQTIAEMAAKIILMRRVRDNMLRIINDCAFAFGDLVTDGVDMIYTQDEDGNRHAKTPEEIAQSCVGNPSTVGLLCLEWLKHVDLTKMEDLPKYTSDMVIEQGL